jgi:hypothetical protein
MSDLSPLSAPKRTSTAAPNLWVHALVCESLAADATYTQLLSSSIAGIFGVNGTPPSSVAFCVISVRAQIHFCTSITTSNNSDHDRLEIVLTIPWNE